MTFDRDTFHDYVASHGFGVPTAEAYQLAEKLFVRNPDYADLGHEVVARGLTSELAAESPTKIVLTAAQVRPLAIMLLTEPDVVGELDDPQVLADFRTHLVEVIARFTPRKLLDAGVVEVLANAGEDGVLHDPDILDAVGGVIANCCGGEVHEVIEFDDTPRLVIRANDSIADPENLLSSNAWRYAYEQPAKPGTLDNEPSPTP